MDDETTLYLAFVLALLVVAANVPVPSLYAANDVEAALCGSQGSGSASCVR